MVCLCDCRVCNKGIHALRLHGPHWVKAPSYHQTFQSQRFVPSALLLHGFACRLALLSSERLLCLQQAEL
eukprot:5365862-Prymnesium_polylepis.1